MEVLTNLAILRDFKPLSPDQMQAPRDQGKQFNDGRYELYKSTVKYDGDLGRSQHGYPSAAELPFVRVRELVSVRKLLIASRFIICLAKRIGVFDEAMERLGSLKSE